jgi:hypothetical protein
LVKIDPSFELTVEQGVVVRVTLKFAHGFTPPEMKNEAFKESRPPTGLL